MSDLSIFYASLWTSLAPRVRPPILSVTVTSWEDREAPWAGSDYSPIARRLWNCALWGSMASHDPVTLLAEGWGPSQEEAEADAALHYVLSQGIGLRALLVVYHADAPIPDVSSVQA